MVLEESVHSIPLCLLLLLGPNTQQNHHITRSITIQHTKDVVWCSLFPIFFFFKCIQCIIWALLYLKLAVGPQKHVCFVSWMKHSICVLPIHFLSMLYTLGYAHHPVCSWWDKEILSVPLAPSSIWQEGVGVSAGYCTLPPSQRLTLYGVIELLGPPLRPPPWQHTNTNSCNTCSISSPPAGVKIG